MKVVQVWKCPECTNSYRAALPVKYVLCNRTESHNSRTNKAMELLEGSPLETRKGRKSEPTNGRQR